eukprot:CAMPEP_0172183250 /NCGR_PEP_ID=MMETSP1050-20130122/18875_1 /TAXON_ID=233186 /ORGANISM="Cryptomonas curvata, Strain CCAP979/52" /LENGTH=605 /DNA_ID=CAMNT_0012856835 /DNA_START=164 /DNA_END=1977 /DNA_ORIENTATION=-
MKALDFSSLREYEDHVLSTGKALPCGLRSHSTAENVTRSDVLSHRHKQTLWSMIFGNFFDDDSDRDHQKTSDRSHNHLQTVSQGLASAGQRKDHHHIIAAARTNGSVLQQHRTHPALVHAESSKKNSIHDTNKITVNAKLSKTPLVNHATAISNRPDINHDSSVPTATAESAGITKHEIDLPLKVMHAHLEGIVVNVSAPPTTRLNTREIDRTSNSGSIKRTKSESWTKSEDWLMKLKREAYHLGYALVPQHRDTSVHSADHRPRELSFVDPDQQHDFVRQEIPAIKNIKSESLIETKKAETPFKTGSVVSAEVKSKYASQDFNAHEEQIERPATVSPLKTQRSFLMQGRARPKASGNENAFEVKDQQRLESEARIEAAMHAQLQAEARRAREKINREGASKAVQAQSAAMDAIKRYANVISFQDSNSDKAKFEKLSLDDRSSSLAKKDDNTIRKKILLSQELRNEAGKAADKQLESYGFLHFSDDGIHEVPSRTADGSFARKALGGDSRAGGTASAANPEGVDAVERARNSAFRQAMKGKGREGQQQQEMAGGDARPLTHAAPWHVPPNGQAMRPSLSGAFNAFGRIPLFCDTRRPVNAQGGLL